MLQARQKPGTERYQNSLLLSPFPCFWFILLPPYRCSFFSRLMAENSGHYCYYSFLSPSVSKSEEDTLIGPEENHIIEQLLTWSHSMWAKCTTLLDSSSKEKTSASLARDSQWVQSCEKLSLQLLLIVCSFFLCAYLSKQSVQLCTVGTIQCVKSPSQRAARDLIVALHILLLPPPFPPPLLLL